MIVSETRSFLEREKKGCFPFRSGTNTSANGKEEGKPWLQDGRRTLTLTCACAQRTTSFLDRASFPFSRWMALSASCGDTRVHTGNKYD